MAGKRNETGTVEGVNENGVKINGAWLNFSKFFKGERSPAKGSSVSIVIGEFNGRDYLNELTVTGTAPVSIQSGNSSAPSYSSRDKSIERQVAFKGAVELAANGMLTPDEIGRYTEKFAAIIAGEPEDLAEEAA